MGILNNKKHFIHEYIDFMESIGIDGKNNGFNNFLKTLGVPCEGDYLDIDHSIIDWNKVKNHHQFFFDYVDNEIEITNGLRNSVLSKYEFLYTWLDWEDPIVKIKTSDFITHWEWFYIASVEGMGLVTEDGRFYLEFTDDYKYHLNSNFKII